MTILKGLALGALLTAGVDVWLNTPQPPPLEASGTSGMKAALNGVPLLSVLDGWWIEGWIEGVTGWAIGATDRGLAANDESIQDAASKDFMTSSSRSFCRCSMATGRASSMSCATPSHLMAPFSIPNA